MAMTLHPVHLPSGTGAPSFLVYALRNPKRATSIARRSSSKGWLDASGETHERIWDVAVSDGRESARTGAAARRATE